MNKELKNIKEAIIWLTERIAELQCMAMPCPDRENPQKYEDDNKKDKVERVKKILDKQ